jgi:carbon storage regulator CsrA
MLVLTRRLGESIAIDDEIKITVVQIKGKQVRIGIEAPRDTVIHREEIYRAIKSGTSAPPDVRNVSPDSQVNRSMDWDSVEMPTV